MQSTEKLMLQKGWIKPI